MNVHFRKSIGVPWDGDVVVDPYEWIGKTFMGKVTTENYQDKKNNKFKEISPIREGTMAALDSQVADEDNPFAVQ